MGKVDNHSDGHNRPNDDAQIPVKGDKISQADLLIYDEVPPINKGNQKGQGRYQVDKGIEYSLKPDKIHIDIEVLLIHLCEIFLLIILLDKGLYYPYPGNILGCLTGQIAEGFLYPAKPSVYHRSKLCHNQDQER